MPRSPRSTLFPYTTLFRSLGDRGLQRRKHLRPEPAAQLRHLPDRRSHADALLRRDDTGGELHGDRKSTRLNSSHPSISYAVFCLKKKSIDTATAFDNPAPT